MLKKASLPFGQHWELLLLRHKKTDRFLIDFGMKQAKAGAWKFEKELAPLDSQQPDETIKQRDKK